VEFTDYFESTQLRPDRVRIKIEGIESTIQQPIRTQIQSDGRIRYWSKIQEKEGRYLRVVLLEDGETVHNAFFDRNFKELEQ
jgi:hypothetical protein